MAAFASRAASVGSSYRSKRRGVGSRRSLARYLPHRLFLPTYRPTGSGAGGRRAQEVGFWEARTPSKATNRLIVPNPAKLPRTPFPANLRVADHPLRTTNKRVPFSRCSAAFQASSSSEAPPSSLLAPGCSRSRQGNGLGKVQCIRPAPPRLSENGANRSVDSIADPSFGATSLRDCNRVFRCYEQ